MTTHTTDRTDRTKIIFDWNRESPELLPKPSHRVEVLDESLRDGIQSPSALDPPVEVKLQILQLMNDLGVDAVDVGLPAASQRNFEDVVKMIELIRDEKLGLKPNCAARTVVSDVIRIAEVQQATGFPVQAYSFIGSSPIRQYTENWSLEWLVEQSRNAIRAGRQEGLEMAYVTEDTMRSDPADLEVLFQAALDEGANCLCLCDTVGHATPDGAKALVLWTLEFLENKGYKDVRIDWHGHNDRGLALANALSAASAGAQRIHGTSIGIGERVGNVALDQLLVNLSLLGWSDRNLQALAEFCALCSESLGIDIPINYPAVGRDAFRTATGVHASAILKAMDKGDVELADIIYSGVNAGQIGRTQVVDIGPMSGKSNAIYWMRNQGIDPTDERIAALLKAAKNSNRTLSDEECREALTGL